MNIAFANELSLLCEGFGIEPWHVISLANRHPRVNILQPGVGVGGHCIAVDPYFLIFSSNVWNGIALGAIDIAVSHTTRKTPQDVGLRVCDYPTIQDAVGEAIMDTNARRMFTYSVAQACDSVTNGAQTNPDPGELQRGNYLHWLWQIKGVFVAIALANASCGIFGWVMIRRALKEEVRTQAIQDHMAAQS